MNKLNALFETTPKDILSIYLTAGYPTPGATIPIIEALERNGVDLIEIGIPFSDPMADGPVIQASNQQALANGFRIDDMFEQLSQLKACKTPLILMSYFNPIFKYGVESFCSKAHAIGISGLIIPDLPLYEYEIHFRQLFEDYNLAFSFLITPQTPIERIRALDKATTGFLYLMTTSATTGGRLSLDDRQTAYFQQVNNLNTRHPILAGFGIRSYSDRQALRPYVNGCIVGSHFIKNIDPTDTLDYGVTQFIRTMKHVVETF